MPLTRHDSCRFLIKNSQNYHKLSTEMSNLKEINAKNPSEKMSGVLCYFMTVLMKQIENKSIEAATPVRKIGLIGNRK